MRKGRWLCLFLAGLFEVVWATAQRIFFAALLLVGLVGLKAVS